MKTAQRRATASGPAQDTGYGSLASWVYQADKPPGRSFGDLEFLRRLLAGVDGPVLEPAVGNGRVAIALAEAGHRVLGFDSSPHMLAWARHNAERQGVSLALSRQSWNCFRFRERMAAVVLPAGSLHLMQSRQLLLSFLRCAHRVLQPGGVLVVDVDAPDSWVDAPPSKRCWPMEGGRALHMLDAPAAPAPAGACWQRLHVYQLTQVGQVLREERVCFRLRPWRPSELVHALRALGFRDLQWTLNYDQSVDGGLDPPPPGARVLTVCARRARRLG